MVWYTHEELKSLGVKQLGKNVLVDKSALIINPEKLIIDDNSRIDAFNFISGDVKIGKYVHVPPFCSFGGSGGIIDIGNFVTFSTRISIFTSNADYTQGVGLNNPTVPKEYRHNENGNVVIEDSVLLGSNCVVLPNSLLKKGCVFGSFSLIKGEYDEWSLYFGIPAKFKKKRPKEKILLQEDQLLKKDED